MEIGELQDFAYFSFGTGIDKTTRRAELEKITGMCDRDNREIIHACGCTGCIPIVSLADGRGYFIPTESEQDLKAELESYNREYGRAMEILRGLRSKKNHLKHNGQIAFDLFDEILERKLQND